MRASIRSYALGIALGLGGSICAQEVTWSTGAEAADQSRAYQMGYAAGTSDMLNGAVLALREGGASVGSDFLKSKLECIQRRAGGTLGQFTDVAVQAWRGRRESAALALLEGVCR